MPAVKKKYELINGMQVTVTEVTETHVFCERPDPEIPGEKFRYRTPIGTWDAVVRKEI